MTTTLPYPWNPNGYVPPSVAHLARIQWSPSTVRPAHTYRPPTPAANITIVRNDPAKAGRIKKAKI